MAVFRIEKTRDYTVMANFHLRDTELSLKAKGLLSLMLSLPEDWDYTTKGLARICRDGVDSICSTVRELEEHGYIIRERVRNEKGQLTTVEYTILEQPVKGEPGTAGPGQEKPKRENPVLGKPGQENPAQLNTNKSNTDLSSTEGSNPIPSNPLGPQAADGDGTDGMMADREAYKQLVMENIEYAYLIQDMSLDKERIDELVELIVDTVCSGRRMIRIAGDDYPAQVVKSRFLKLDSSHIRYVLSSMSDNTTYIRNIKKYLLAALYNAPATIGNYYSALVNHDMYGTRERR
ncbi:MAG: helix-turn-helix domain-containing protein [Lachnospiraceae bacterium]|nr:helix-turn-helix domain-containing protein [Lachnospiraceae bacterium]